MMNISPEIVGCNLHGFLFSEKIFDQKSHQAFEQFRFRTCPPQNTYHRYESDEKSLTEMGDGISKIRLEIFIFKFVKSVAQLSIYVVLDA